jgi:hypothetical protein
MAKRLATFTGLMIATVLLAAGLIGTAGAQGSLATPDAGAPSHPAHIHTGTCATLGDVEFPLENVTASETTASPEASPTLELASTPAVSGRTLTSTTTVETTLDELLGGEHAINLHESDANIQNYVACGDVTGTPSDGMLTIELAELNGSGVTGQATLTDNGDGTTTVLVQVTHGAMATPAA